MTGVVVLMAVLSACSGSGGETTPSSPGSTSSELDGGPLQIGLDDGTTRVTIQGRVDAACRASFGDAFENVTDKPVVITDARFQTTEGVSVLGIMKMPEGSRGIGNPPGFPPRGLRSRWPQVRELVGSTIKPGEFVWLVIGLRLEAKRGMASNIAIEYEVDGERYRATDNDRFKAVSRPGDSCAG